ncbi:MAG: FxsA family protein, partial [Oceanospirillaceae bacterium]|nr:FxsA family protein [Oceanospirillaceae bacterium]
LVLLSAFVGVNMLRYQGLATLTRARAKLDQGEMPIGEMGDGILIAVGGALLITPGFFTDFLGFCCLVPLTRHLFIKNLAKGFMSWMQRSGKAQFHYSHFEQRSGGQQSSDEIIDGEFVDLGEARKPKADDSRLPPR